MTLTMAERDVIRILSAAGRIYGDFPKERAEEPSEFHRALNAVIAVIEACPVHRAAAGLQPTSYANPQKERLGNRANGPEPWFSRKVIEMNEPTNTTLTPARATSWHKPYCVGGQPVDQFDFVMHSLTCVRLALRCDGGVIDNDSMLAMADVLDFVNAGLGNLRPIVAAAEDHP